MRVEYLLTPLVVYYVYHVAGGGEICLPVIHVYAEQHAGTVFAYPHAAVFVELIGKLLRTHNAFVLYRDYAYILIILLNKAVNTALQLRLLVVCQQIRKVKYPLHLPGFLRIAHGGFLAGSRGGLGWAVELIGGYHILPLSQGPRAKPKAQRGYNDCRQKLFHMASPPISAPITRQAAAIVHMSRLVFFLLTGTRPAILPVWPFMAK